jgi:branched-chain amino acid transport system permease protein
MNQFISSILIGFSQGSIYALMALALVLVFRSTRVVNFAQAGQAMVSTYIGWEVINRTGSYWLAIPIAALGGAILAVGVQNFLMRPLSKRTSQGAVAPVANVIVTLGLLGVLHSGAAIIWGSDEKLLTSPVSVNGFKIGENVYPFSQTDVFVIVTSVIVMLIFAFIFKKTNLGLALRAAAFQPDISRLLKGQFREISVERIMRLLTRLGCEVDIVIKPPGRKRASSIIHLKVARP